LHLVREPVDIELTTVYTSIGVRSFGKGIFHYQPVEGSGLSKLRWFKVRPRELVVSNIKGWEGAIAVSSDADIGSIASNRFLTYAPTEANVDVDYLRYYFLSEPGLALIRRASPGSTDRNLTLGREAFESLEIPLPSIEEQRRIASRLAFLASAGQALESCHTSFVQALAALPSALVSRHDLSDEAKAALGWRRVALRDVMELSTSKELVDPSKTYRIAGVYSFGRGLINRDTISGSDTSYKTLARLTEGDVVVSRLGGWEGAVAVVDAPSGGAYVSAEFPTFKLDRSKLLPAFFTGIAQSPWFWDVIHGNTRGSMARRKRVSAQHVLSVLIWLPPISQQTQTAAIIEKALSAQQVLTRMSDLNAALRPAALNEALAHIQ
jgi:type I restriction enzyme S subunit